jgi:hypothetical protein
MSTKDDGGAAFPVAGMTLRDYFAAHAMQALITGLAAARPDNWRSSDQWAPAQAYMVADAMLKARPQP